jgi:hypothetical protein
MRGRRASAADAGGQTIGETSSTAATARRRALLGIGLAAVLLLLLLAATATAEEATEITVLSSRADLVVDDEALLEISVPSGEDPHNVAVTVGGQDVTPAFTVQSAQTLQGLVTGLKPGKDVLTARLPDGSGAKITLTDHPQGGPLFSGPQIQPWKCEGGATDSQCNKPATYSYLYKSSNPEKTKLEPYNPESPPEDVATIEVNGHTVPFIVRTETGYQDRDQYSISTLYNPAEPWSAVSPQPQFAHKLLITHGFGCGVAYESLPAPNTTGGSGSVTPGASWALSHGWAVMSTALDHNGQNCDLVTSAESLVMAKSRVIDQYGTLRYTVGIGCSGGSLTQQWVANAYPGVYQGILPSCSFPDAWSNAAAGEVMDDHLLNKYFANKEAWGSGVSWTAAQEAAVEGTPSTTNSLVSDGGFFYAIEPGYACPGTTAEDRYNELTNPGGVRCDMADYAMNVFGPRPESEWGPQEKELGHGFAGLPISNDGVQYGLSALREGKITATEFIDLNTKIGSLDPETIKQSPGRLVAARNALTNAYRSGMINETNNMDQVAIIDCRGPNPEQAHDVYRAFAVRARLDREHGTHANDLIWEGPTAQVASPNCQEQSLLAMDGWLSAVAADARSLPLPTKIIADRPAELSDRCYNGAGEVTSTNSLCGQSVTPIYGTARIVAGEPLTSDTNECRTQPLKKADGGLGFNEEQLAALAVAFPTGVCNYKKQGVSQKPTIPWLTYQSATGGVTYGGKPLPKEPVSKPLR